MTIASMRLLRPLRDRSMALLWAGLAFSAIGDQAYIVAVSWISAAAFGPVAGWLIALGPAAVLATVLFAGRIADGLPPLAAMIGADAARAAVLLTAVVAWSLTGAPPVWALVTAIIVLGAGQAVFRPALQVVVPALVPDRRDLPAANALLDATDRLARLAGPALAGLVASLIPLQHLLTLDAATFAVSAAALWAIQQRRTLPGLAAPGASTVLQAMTRGFRAARRHPLMAWVLATAGLLNGAWYVALFLALPLLLTQTGAGLPAFGLIISAYGCTNLAANLFLGSRNMPDNPARQICLGNLVVGTGILLMACAALLPPGWQQAGFMAAAAIAAPGGPMQDIPVAVLRQTAFVPPDVPAVMRAHLGVSQAGLLAGMALAPILLSAMPPAPVIAFCALAMIGIGLNGLRRFNTKRG